MTRCVVCKNTLNFTKKYKILTKCKNCSHIFYDNDLNYKDLKKIYSNEYFFGKEYINYIEDKKQVEKNSLKRIKTIKKYIPNLSDKKLLEIGSAYGFFLNIVKNKFRELEGYEINKDAVNYAKKKFQINIFNDNFLDKKFNNTKFDVCCLFDVIEHLNDPDQYIKKISENSSKNSFIFITTGDINSVLARILGKNWRLIHPPSHIHYFSKRSIEKLLKNNGYEIISNTYLGYYRNLSFILNKLNFIKNNFNWLIKIIDYFNLSKFDIYINVYDIMLVVAKKNK